MDVNNTIRCIRRSKGITAAHVARRLQMDRSQYCHVEKGRRRLTVDLLVDLARILDVDVAIFFDEKVNETKTNGEVGEQNETAV